MELPMTRLPRLPRVPRLRHALLLLSLVAVLAPGAGGASSSSELVVSQVFAGGGNAGAPYQNDFVELLNRSASSVDLSGWTVQYAPATGTSWQATALSGSVAPGHYYLVQLASAAAVGATLPTPDATGTSNLAASGGKVALVRSATALTCGATVGSCSASTSVEDLVGYGTATDYEGAGAAPALDNTTADLRAEAGCTDTDTSSADFSAAAPAPRTTASAAASCGALPSPTAPTQDASVNLDIQPVIAISLEHSSLGFGQAVTGSTPSPLSEHVTVSSNQTTGYSLSVHRSVFVPSDLPLAIGATAPAGGQLGGSVAGGTLAPIPVAPAADLLLGTTSAASPAAGDVWPTSVGFSAPLPAVAPGHYTATITFTVIGR
ncbi:MAG: lamin tail domain-containing protein [Gaiellaceae bacterium]